MFLKPKDSVIKHTIAEIRAFGAKIYLEAWRRKITKLNVKARNKLSTGRTYTMIN